MKIKQKGGIEYYSLPEGTILYRGDSTPQEDDNLKLDNRITFFGFDQGNVEDNYGVAYEFRTNKDLKLIALDKNRETNFLDIVKDKCKDNDEYNKIKQILDRNYGYRNGIRDSVSDKDKTISEFICKKFPEYHGYACEQMETEFGGTFHSESMICEPQTHLDGGKRVTLDDKIESMRQEYYARRAKPDKNKKTKSRLDEGSPSELNLTSYNDYSSPPRNKSRLFEGDTPPRNSRRLFEFGGKRKTKKRNSKKQKSKKRKQSLRK
jgi:hypothetical protein